MAALPHNNLLGSHNIYLAMATALSLAEGSAGDRSAGDRGVGVANIYPNSSH